MPAQGATPAASWAAAPQSAAGGTAPQGATPAAPWAAAPQSAAAPHAAQPSGSGPVSPWAASADSGRAQSSPWAAQRRPQQERVTSRLRRVVEGLPDWEPLPPGETLVRRPGSTA
ncbi:hypothetical protein [Streptomyces sp. Ag109_G2-15]|uniref:hypothetical protein n=1 Tax=Streptomyces sp. Ag109_G2-15 TaxID=1938850 RepID=UPI0015CF2C2C|nr:hypothetical protein [Streptomyces sp. Ag109_G2-15]